MSGKTAKPRGRRGILAMTLALTLAVIVLFVGVNWLATALEKRYALSVDLSFNALTLQSAVTEETLKALDQPVSVYMLTTSAGDTVGGSVILRADLRTILERYRSLSPQISLYEENLLSAPTWSTRFSDLLNGESVTEDCVILYCEATRRARMLTADDFLRRQFDLDSQTFIVSAYAIEKALTEGIVYVSSAETPVAQVLTGHGELPEADTATLEAHLNDAGYQVRRVSLHGADSLDAVQPLLILCPQFDMTEEELSWLRAYLDAGGGVLYAVSYQSPTELPRFNALLSGYGLSILPGIVVANGDDPTSYFNDSPVTLLPYMQAAPETQELLGSGQDILVMPGTRAVAVSEARNIDIYTESLLKSGSAYLRGYEDGLETLDRQPDDPEGTFDLAALARKYDGERALGTVILVGNEAMFTEEWIYENTYQDAFLRALLKGLGTARPVSLDISVKSAARAGLGMASLDWAVWAAALLPALTLIVALIVLLPRRHQ